MKNRISSALAVFAALALLVGCSGMGTTMTKMGRLGQNKGYEIAAELPAVQSASVAVLKSHGYEVSIKADPENGAEGAGQIVIGQKVANYVAEAGTTGSPKKMDTRDLVNVYLSKKWTMSGGAGAAMITLVDVGGTSYLRSGPGSAEEATAMTSESMTLLRDEIERKVVSDAKAEATAQ